MAMNARLIPWRSTEELIQLRSLYSSQDEISLRRAVSRTDAYESKGPIPHTITSTKQLTLLKLQFKSLHDFPGTIDKHILQMSATMTLIRFVNGLLDPSQQSQYAIPLNLLAKKISLPSKFVELRHMGTHEAFPSLEMLEIGVNEALVWLFDNFWSGIDQEEEKLREKELKLKEEEDKKRFMIVELKTMLKSYRRIRRNDINKVFKNGESSEAAKEYWNLLNQIRSHIDIDGFNDVLIERFINGKVQFDISKRLYDPLMKFLIKEDGFLLEFIDSSLKRIYEYEKLQKLEFIKNDDEETKLKAWLEYLVTLPQLNNDEDLLDSLIDVLSKQPMQVSLELLGRLTIKSSSLLTAKIESKKSFLKNLLESVVQPKREIKEIDDITNDLENLKKRLKMTKKESLPIKIFERAVDWKPRPIGTLE